MKGGKAKLKADQGAIVLQLWRSTKVSVKSGNGKHRDNQGNAGTRAVMSRGF